LEILALLLLGLIAMLAIVPPIIRGKLEQSPLVTSQNFQRSMQEIAESLEPCGRPGASRSRDAVDPRGIRAPAPSARIRQGDVRVRSSSRSRAAVRRNRVITALTLFAALWGVATLISGKSWCLILFLFSCCVLVAFWVLSLFLPNRHSARSPRRVEEISRPPQRQAM
jgi:hypothetical protein